MSKYIYNCCTITAKPFEGLVEVDGVLARVGGRRRQGEARHYRCAAAASVSGSGGDSTRFDFDSIGILGRWW